MKPHELAEYIHFDVGAFYRDRVKLSAETIETLKEAGNWNEQTQLLHKYWHAHAEHDLKTFLDAPPDIKRGICHLFLKYIRIVKPIPDANIEAEIEAAPTTSIFVGDDDE
jgi:hypothetical protein